MHASHPAVQKVLLALSMSAIGRRDSDIALVQAGIRAYSRTVQNLAGMIASGAASMNSDVALILVKGLNTFEVSCQNCDLMLVVVVDAYNYRTVSHC